MWTGATSLPESIGMLKHLQRIHLSHTPLVHIPDSIAKLTALQYMLATHKAVLIMPMTIGCLRSLRVLDLGHTGITAMPRTISALTKLTQLIISSTKLATIPNAVASLTRLCDLRAADMGLTSFPSIIETLGTIKHYNDRGMQLDLSNNQIKDIPNWISSLGVLRGLSLKHNLIENLTMFPKRGLPLLNSLDISFNQLESLPNVFTQFVKNSPGLQAALKLSSSHHHKSPLRLSHNYLNGQIVKWLAQAELFPQVCRPGFIRDGQAFLTPRIGGSFGRCVMSCNSK